jgi:hypothetical protein
MTADTARLRELAQYVDPGPWRAARSEFDGTLMLYDAAGNPLAAIYAGHDLAVYLAGCSPAALDLEARP